MGRPKNNRVGEINYNNQGELMTIVEYNNSIDMIIKFDSTGILKKCAYKEFKSGHVHDNFYPSVCGVGYIGDTSITIGNKIIKHSYRTWSGMILRCYSDKYHDRYKSYADCSVCKEWHCYANFEKWYNENYYEVENEAMNLDKDILVKGNKLYSPDTCIFVPQTINALFTKREQARGKYPIGVTRDKRYGKFAPQVQGVKWLGYYNTPEEAFKVYKENKEKRIKQIAEEYKDKIPDKLYDSLCNYKVDATD